MCSPRYRVSASRLIRPASSSCSSMLPLRCGSPRVILLAFVVFVVWGYYQDAKTAASNEAIAVYAIWGVSNGFASQEGLEIRQAAIDYGVSVIRDDWPALARGKQSPKTTAAIGALRG